VGLAESEVINLNHLLAGVLHTGDIEFGGGEDDNAYVVSADDILGKVGGRSPAATA